MTKLLVLSAVAAGLLAGVMPAAAQTVLLSESFDNPWSTAAPPPGWRIYWDGDTTTNDWHRAPDLGLNPWFDNPTPYALIDSQPNEFNEDSLLTPLVNCAGYNVIVLRCSTYFIGSTRPGYTAQLVGAVDGGPFEHVIFDYGQVGNIGPALQEFNLSWAVGHSQVQLCWYLFGGSDAISFWAVDNVTIIGDNVTDDVGCVAIIAPTDTIDSNVMVPPSAIFKNFTDSLVTFPVRVSIGFAYSKTDTVRNLAGHESTTVVFPPWTAAPRGILPVDAMTLLRGDIDPSNDTSHGFCFVRVRDVGASSITAPRDTVDSGQTVTPLARIRNFGTDTATFGAYFRIGAWMDSASIVQMSPGDEWEVPFPNWQANASGFVTARCSTAWSMDPYREDDTTSVRFFVKPPHYKDVASIRIIQPPGLIGESTLVTPSGVIHSYCDDPQTATVYFTVCNGGIPVYTDSMSQPIQPGESALVSFTPWIATPQGSFTDTLRVRLDGDANTENDTVSGQFQVLAGFHDVGVVTITSPTDTVQAGSVVPGAVVKNYGTSQEVFTVRFKIRRGQTQVYEDSAIVTALNPNESTAVTFPTWTAVGGNYTARCTTDLPGDVVPANDWLEQTFVVESLPPPPPGWHEAASMPLLPSSKDIKDGGWLVYDHGSKLIFAAKGNKQTDFYSYYQSGDSWRTLSPIPLGVEAKPPSKGAAACTDGNGTLYATKGNNKLGFYKYSSGADAWSQLKDVPLGISNKKVKGGTSLAHAYSGGQPWVYLLKGYKNEFYRYDPTGDSWNTLPPAPVGQNVKWDKGSWIVHDGASTIYAHKAKYHELWTFNTEANTWSPDSLHAMPIAGSAGNKKSKDGSCAAWFDGTITALKGGNTQEFWRYTVSSNSWTELDTIPLVGSSTKKKKVKAGGSLVSVDGNNFYAIKGNKCRELWRYGSGGVGVREAYTAATPLPRAGGLTVVPNPTTGFATVRLHSLLPAPYSLSVHDIRGSLIVQCAVTSPAARLDCRGLVPGVYFVRAENPDFRATCRLVRE